MSAVCSQSSKSKLKGRKVLSLEERMQAIRLYEIEPIYQRVASKFECSWEQIRNIIANRQSILSHYVRCQIIESTDDVREVRRKKINFLGTVVFEFLKRAKFHHSDSVTLNDYVLQQTASSLQQILDIDKFYPNRAWVHDFKQNYNVDFDVKGSNILVTITPELSLNCADIVKYCQNDLNNLLAKIDNNTESQDNNLNSLELAKDNEAGVLLEDNTSRDSKPANNLDLVLNNIKPEEVEIKTENFNIDESSSSCDNSIQTKNSYQNNEKSTLQQVKYELKSPETALEVGNQIKNYVEALTWLRPLEIFTLNKEDFVAMNLLTQLIRHYERKI